ncbi:MAG: hypothetical protein ACJART_000634 [Maribacter sp.]|jgi:hypothetical protein
MTNNIALACYPLASTELFQSQATIDDIFKKRKSFD